MKDIQPFASKYGGDGRDCKRAGRSSPGSRPFPSPSRRAPREREPGESLGAPVYDPEEYPDPDPYDYDCEGPEGPDFEEEQEAAWLAIEADPAAAKTSTAAEWFEAALDVVRKRKHDPWCAEQFVANLLAHYLREGKQPWNGAAKADLPAEIECAADTATGERPCLAHLGLFVPSDTAQEFCEECVRMETQKRGAWERITAAVKDHLRTITFGSRPNKSVISNAAKASPKSVREWFNDARNEHADTWHRLDAGKRKKLLDSLPC